MDNNETRKRRGGRRALLEGQPSAIVGTRVTLAVDEAIKAIKTRDNLAKSEVVRRLIDYGLAIDSQLNARAA